MKKTFDKSIGERLRHLIFMLKISQTAFSQQIGMSRGYISEILTGNKGVGAEFLQRFSKEYKNISLRWLLMGEGDMYDLPNYYPPPELESGQTDKLEEGVRIEYTKPAGQLEAMQRQLNDHERRLRDLEGRK